jgi:aspartyl-tRNA synthetase
MKRILASETIKYLNKKVLLKGWVNTKRNLGKLIFVDLRDISGLVQILLIPQNLDENSKKILKKVKEECVIEVEGIVQKRPENQINEKLLTGEIEVLAKRISLLSEAKVLPFPIDNENIKPTEKLKLRYRYLYLRRKKMKENLISRYKIIKFLRDFLDKEGFTEIETPILTRGTPEGAREFIVPSRIHQGKFYVLPQSPQQFKQLLMIAGFEKYFQVCRCFRDEDTRNDRQPEFTQLDLEMSFIEEKDIFKLVEKMMLSLIRKLFPNKKITQIPFPVISFNEAISKYNTDKPDLRKDKNDQDELAFCWIYPRPLFEYSETEKKIVSAHHPFTSPMEKDLEILEKDPLKVMARAYDLVLNGNEIAGGSIRISQKDLQFKIFKILNLKENEIKEKFGHFLKAFDWGVPIHGGIAFGLDRLIMILLNEENIREVIAFPKTADHKDLLMNAPSELDEKALKEVHIKVIK